MNKVEEKTNSNTEEIEGTSVKVGLLEEDVKKIKDTCKDYQPSEEVKDDVFKEFNERETRKDNLVVHNVPEPVDCATAEDKKYEDQRKIGDIFRAAGTNLDLANEIKFMYRAGEKGKQANSGPRPLIIGFRNQASRELIYRSARKLKNSQHADIYIVPDLTARQRKDEENLRQEAEKRNGEMNDTDSGNWEWKVIGPKGQKRLIKAKKTQDDNNSNSNHNTRKKKRSVEEVSPGPSRKR